MRLVWDKLSRADYNSKQKGSFELTNPQWAAAYFQTDNGNYGKLPTHGELAQSYTSRKSLPLTHDSVRPKFVKQRHCAQSTGHMDLDDGIGTHPNANGWDGGKCC